MNPRQQELLFDLDSDIDEVRKSALIWLAQVGDPDAVPHLRKLTRDPVVALRHFAKRAIDAIETRHGGEAPPAPGGDHADLETLREDLGSDDASAVISAARELAARKDPEGAARAGVLITGATEPARVVALVHLLASREDPSDLFLLLGRLTDSDPTIRGEAVMALTHYYDPMIPDHLLPMVHDPDNRVRGNVLLVLGRYDEDLIQAPLTEMALSREVWMRDSAIWVCGELASERSVEILGRLYREVRSDTYLGPKVEEVLNRLARSGSVHAVRVLEALRAGRFEQETHRRDFLRVLEGLEQELMGHDPSRERRVERTAIESLDDFVRCLAEPAFEARLSAVESGFRFDRDAVVEAFRRQLDQETHPFVLSKLAKELGRLGGVEDVDAIARQLQHPDDRVRANAVEGLAFIGGDPVYEWVKPLEEDPSARVRANVLRILYRIDRDRSLRRLKQMILSPNPEDSGSAVFTLGEIYSDDLIELIELALGNEDQEVRLRVLKVLQMLSRKSGLASELYARFQEEGDRLLIGSHDIALARRMSRDPAPEVRIQAYQLLGSSPHPDARRALEQGQRDPEPRVREQAARSLAIFDLHQERLVQLYRIGSVVYRAVKSEELLEAGLVDRVQAIEIAGREMERGGDFAEQMERRNRAIQDLAGEVLTSLAAGRFEAFGGVEELRKLAADLEAIDRRIELRVEELDHQEVERQAARASGKSVAAEAAGGVATVLGRVGAAAGRLLEDNRVAGGIGLALVLVAGLSVFGWMLAGPSFAPGWESPATHGVTHLERVGDRVLALDPSGSVVALAGHDGSVAWRNGSRSIPNPYPPIVDGGVIVLSGPAGQLVGLDRATGREIWNAKLGEIPRPPYKLGPQLWVFTAGPTASVHWIDPASGRIVGRKGVGGQDVLGVAPLGEHVLVVRERSIRLSETNLEKTVWSADIPAPILPDPLPFAHGKLICVRTATELVMLDLGGRRHHALALASSGRVFPPRSRTGRMLLVDGTTLQEVDREGQVAREVALGAVPMVLHPAGGSVVYATDESLRRIHLASGKDTPVESGGAPIRDLLAVDRVLLVGTAQGVRSLSLEE